MGKLLSPGTTKDRHNAAFSSLSELKLTFADFFEISASLNKGFVFGKDAIILFPVLLARSHDDTLLDFDADLFPLATAVNALVKVTHAFLDVTAEHVLLVNLLTAPLVDLVADLG